MPPVGLEPTVLVGERPQTCSLDGEATGNGIGWFYDHDIPVISTGNGTKLLALSEARS